MHPLAAMASGFVATLGVIGLGISGPLLSAATTSSEIAPANEISQSVNRSSKGDRLPRPTAGQQRPVQPSSTPVRTLQDNSRQRLEGCDPLVSPLVKSPLSQVAGRCIAAVGSLEKPA
jgi:hypothetical protein